MKKIYESLEVFRYMKNSGIKIYTIIELYSNLAD